MSSYAEFATEAKKAAIEAQASAEIARIWARAARKIADLLGGLW